MPPRSKNMINPFRALTVLAAISAIALSARALPVMPGLVMPALGTPDRDVVRDPYSSFAGNMNRAIVAVPGANVMSSFSLPVGGGFGGGTVSPTPFGIANISSPVRSGVPVSPVFFSPPPPPPVYLALFTPPPQTNVTVGAVRVPEGGITVALLGASLVGMVVIRRSRIVSRWFKN